MISKKDIDAYKSITAPPELKDRILSSSQHTRLARGSYSYGIRLACVAACMVMVSLFAYTSFFRILPGAVSLDGYTIGESGQTLEGRPALARGGSISLDLNFSVKETTEVSVSQGCLSHFDNDHTESILGQSTSINKDTQLVWTVELSVASASPRMTLTGHENQSSYIIRYDKEDNEWYIFKE